MKQIKSLYQELKKKYGWPQGQWKLWRKRVKTNQEREEVIIGSLLTQRTNWNNVELALNNLKQNGIRNFQDISRAYCQKRKWLENLIKPSGFYKQKTRYLYNLTAFILEKYQGIEGLQKVSLEQLRKELLLLKGIGPETADSILLYALDKPIFVIDEYTRRLVKKENLSQNFSYPFLQKLFEKNLRKDFRLYQDFHALIVIDGKKQKRAQKDFGAGKSRIKEGL